MLQEVQHRRHGQVLRGGVQDSGSSRATLRPCALGLTFATAFWFGFLQTFVTGAQIENGRFQQAAKMYKEVAEIAEADGVVDEALKNFKLAAEYYAQVICLGFVDNAHAIAVILSSPSAFHAEHCLQEEQTSTANTMFLKVAAISATLERYRLFHSFPGSPT